MVRFLSALIALTLFTTPALAFCGFYVSSADGSLYNSSSKIVFTRVNDTSVITMSSDYQGTPADFAMIVPTPYVLTKQQVHVVDAKIVDHLDTYTAPRLAETFDFDPCEMGGMAEPVMEMALGAPAKPTRREGARALGVRILSEYAVGSYDISMLSAEQSDGLVTFLRGEGYKLPDGAEQALQGYIKMGMKFFVAKVNLQRHSADKVQDLQPLQISFRSKMFMLPLQLGKVNGKGAQDMIVMLLTRNGRVDLANYPTGRIPTDKDVPVFVAEYFGQFYKAMFNKIAPTSGAFLEYAWDMAWCDPCAGDPLSFDEFRKLGVVWVTKATANTPNVFATRLHIRYDKNSFPEDLMFKESNDRENFQGRYVLNHPFEGEITCAEGKQYVADTRKRIKEEAATLRALTGWKQSVITHNIAATTPARYR